WRGLGASRPSRRVRSPRRGSTPSGTSRALPPASPPRAPQAGTIFWTLKSPVRFFLLTYPSPDCGSAPDCKRCCKRHASIILRLAAAQLYERIVTRFVASVAAGLCFPCRVVPKFIAEYRLHFSDLPIGWLRAPRTWAVYAICCDR